MRRRRRKISIWIELYAISRDLPWWNGVVLALMAYFGFGLVRVGMSELPLAVIVATFLQLLVTAIIVFGAAGSWFGRRKRLKLLARIQANREMLAALSWREFEQLVGEAFRQGGYTVLETGLGGADGGVDLALLRNGKRYLVQCKHWRGGKVPVQVVRELLGVITAWKASGGFVVASEGFTREASEFANGTGIGLIGGDELHRMIREARSTVNFGLDSSQASDEANQSTQDASTPPPCPICSPPMLVREAKRGNQPGSKFWGCPKFPKCRGTLRI